LDVLEALRAGAPIERSMALVVAHPDDETVGLGSRLNRIADLRIVHLTDGAPRDLVDARMNGHSEWRDYARARAQELDGAISALGADHARRIGYAYPDQESIFHVVDAARRLCVDLDGVEIVVTHPYEHGHPDHDTCAMATHLARDWLGTRGRAPMLLEFASYHLAYGKGVPGYFWSEPGRPEFRVEMTDEDVRRKRAAVACHRTQLRLLSRYPIEREIVRAAPDYDFSRPAPPGEAVYDRFGWAITSAIWRAEAARARQQWRSRPGRLDGPP
jgi:LmbE family N-acetylglucosaminyl deacetylase